MTTLYAIVDKAGKTVDCGTNRRHLLTKYTSQVFNNGYRCIQLHTYDPEREVVIDLDTYREAQDVILYITKNRHDHHLLNKFLSAGKEKP